jgi:hypothetical protein
MMLAIRLLLLTKTTGDCRRIGTCNCVETSCFFPQGFCVLGPLRIIVTVGGFGLKYIVEVVVGVGRVDLIEQIPRVRFVLDQRLPPWSVSFRRTRRRAYPAFRRRRFYDSLLMRTGTLIKLIE